MSIVKRNTKKANGRIAPQKEGDKPGARKPKKVARDPHAKLRAQLINHLSALSYSDNEPVHGFAMPPREVGEGGEVKPLKFRFTIRDLRDDPGLLDRLVQLNQTRGIYISPNAGGHKDADITSFKAFFAEFDDRPIEEQIQIFKNSPLPPSILIVTKKSVHSYWILDGDCDREQWEDCQRRIIAHFGSDPFIKNPARRMRLPGFDHLSLGEQQDVIRDRAQASRLHAIFGFVPSAIAHTGHDLRLERKRIECVLLDPLRRYTVEQVQEAFPQVEANNKRARALGEDEPINEHARNTTLMSIAGSMRRRGLSSEEIYPALMAVNERRCKPPLNHNEVSDIAEGVTRYDSNKNFALTDLGNAERLVARYGHDLRYCHEWGKWLVWDGKHWETDNTAAIMRMAKETVRSIYGEAAGERDDAKRSEKVNWGRQSESEKRLKAMVALATSEPGIAVISADLDPDPWLLNVVNGTIDLKIGKLREHRREDLMTKIAPVEYDPKAEAPEWHSFLKSIMDGNRELINYLQRAIGYSITGSTSEQVVFFCSGVGSNGKSTLLDTLQQALGDYAMRTPTETLMAKRAGGISNDLARLKGARFVTAMEGEDGQRLAESLIKQMTGGDKVSARFLRQEFFEFKPEAKIWLATNHKPVIRGSDHAIWRRIMLIPFPVTFVDPKEDYLLAGINASSTHKKDKRLPEKLTAELPGVLRWAVEGCIAWQREGLGVPDEVRKATSDYREEMDMFGAFLTECCIFGADKTILKGDLYRRYSEWCKESNAYPLSKPRFGHRLKERGIGEKKSGQHQWKGIDLANESFISTGLKSPELKEGKSSLVM